MFELQIETENNELRVPNILQREVIRKIIIIEI